jgi:YtoQ family protein
MQLPVVFSSAVTVHDDSDNCGVEILGAESSGFWKDHKGAKLNAIRTRTLLEQADIVVVRFGDKYRQWNAAFDAGFAAAMGKPIITLRDSELTHPMKEVDAAALAVAETPDQVVRILNYVIEGKLA